jgi:hypothetical protein
MKVITFAAGLAAGYVLGSRAGREKYEQIVAGWRKVSSHPTVVQAAEKAESLLVSGADALTSKAEAAVQDAPPSAPAVAPRPRTTRRKTAAATTTPAVVVDPTG